MAYEDDYIGQLNLGSKNALESAAPAPTEAPPTQLPAAEGTPAGFGLGHGMPEPESFSPPEIYRTHPLSLEGQKEVSVWDRIVGAMINAGTQPGDMPITQKMHLAQAQTRHLQTQDELAWKNFNQGERAFKNLLEQQEKDNLTAVMGMQAGVIAQMREAASPEAKKSLYVGYRSLFKRLAPGSETTLDAWYETPFHVDMMQAAAGDINTPAAKEVRDLYASLGPNIYKNPNGIAAMKVMGHDGLAQAVLGFVGPTANLLHSGKMKETEFRTALKERMLDPAQLGWKAGTATAIESYLDTPEGEQFMREMGVITGQQIMEKQKKDKNLTAIQIEQDDRFEKNKAAIEFAKANPGLIDPKKIAQMEEQNAIAIGDRAKRSNQGENPNNPTVQRFDINTQGKYGSYGDVEHMEEGPLKEEAYAAKAKARQESDAASAKNAAAEKMAMQHDNTTHQAYKMNSDGDIVPFKGALTEEAYRRGDGGIFTMSSDQQQRYSKIQMVKHGGARLTDMAEQAYSHNDAFWNVKDEMLMKTELTAAIVAKTNPDLYNYVKQRDVVLGNYAKALGGEVGVLTDQDILRVKNMFASPSSSPKTRAATRKAFEELIRINEEAVTKLLVGNQGTEHEGQLTPGQLAAIKNDKGLRARIEKVFSTVAGTAGSERQKNAESESANPSGNKPSRSESLADRMMKGQ